MTKSIDKKKIEKELNDIFVICSEGSKEFWAVSDLISGIHEGKYDVANSDIGSIEISKKLDHIESMIRNYRGCKM